MTVLKGILKNILLLVVLSVAVTAILLGTHIMGHFFGPFGALAGIIVVGAIVMQALDSLCKYFDINL